ncbi:hypothetical protein HWD35_18980 [Tsukamurella tyrosinosolvens]|uniref:hypothetical protein n=1 Tax=Tsukamurella tyrosinosolvens TaxID=57704 RepID=UPI001CE1AB40|nr:hypothetical protein [Tsukamurella tyrosinosolvens]MCA4996804.1 hypothetical protein [Tsukamurella tyrosinosolvens]
MRTKPIILTKLGRSPEMQPTPPPTDDPAVVEDLAVEIVRLANRMERVLYRLELCSRDTAPASADHVARLRVTLARSTLTWLSTWPRP